MSHPLTFPADHRSRPIPGRKTRFCGRLTSAALGAIGLVAFSGAAWAQSPTPPSAAPAHAHTPAGSPPRAPAAPLALQPGTAAPGNPLAAGTPVPPMRYQSAMAAYRPWREQDVGDWRALNDNVGRIGGWRTYLQQAHAPDPEPAAPGSPGSGAVADTGGTTATGHDHGAGASSSPATPQAHPHRGGHHGQHHGQRHGPHHGQHHGPGAGGAHGGHRPHGSRPTAPAAPRQP